MNDKFILDNDHRPIRVDDVLEWGEWMQTHSRRVRLTKLPGFRRLSTIFLGLDHRFGEGDPLLFETMLLQSSGRDDACERYETWDEALSGHQLMLNQYARFIPSLYRVESSA